MKNTVSYLLLAGLLLTASCCEENKCPAFDAGERSNWLPHAAGNTVIFESSSVPATLTFTVTRAEATETYVEPSRNSGIGCYVKDCAASASTTWQTIDTAALGAEGYSLRIESDFIDVQENRRYLSYRLGDFNGSFDTYPLLNMHRTEASATMERDSIVDKLSLGSHNYQNVVIQTRNPADTTMYYVQKVYLAPGYGLVGFVSKGRLYYRQ